MPYLYCICAQSIRLILEASIALGSELKFRYRYCDDSTGFAHGLYNPNLNLHILHLDITYFKAHGQTSEVLGKTVKISLNLFQ